MFNYCVGFLLAIALVFSKEIVFSEAKNSCSSNSDCPNYSTCCRGFTWRSDRSCKLGSSSCLRRFCLSNSDCNDVKGECCVANKCTYNCPSCSSIRDCKFGKYCCFSKNNRKNQCDVNCLGRYCANKWSCGGSQECCRSNVCVNCSIPECRNHHECNRRQYCCKNKGIPGRNICDAECVGATCGTDSDCARNECCHGKKCVNCVSLECSSNYECGDAYCCGRGLYKTSRCMQSGCIGQNCDTRYDCRGPNECCRGKKCVNCFASECKDNSECPVGEFCCKGDGKAVCKKSCVGQFCYSNENCSVPGECCIDNRCTTFNCTCSSRSDCGRRQYCCQYSGKHTGYCRTNCTGTRCVTDLSCSPGEKCTYPDGDCHLKPSSASCPNKEPESKCFSRNGCYFHNDCNSFGSGYYCCRGTWYFSTRSCNSNCINKFCKEDTDCGGSNECCDREKKKCVECPKTPNDFPVWAIVLIVLLGVLVVICLICGYFRYKICRVRVSLQQLSQPSPTAPQEIPQETTPSWGTETENGDELYTNIRDMNAERYIEKPSAPPLELYLSTLNLPPPPSYDSLFQKR